MIVHAVKLLILQRKASKSSAMDLRRPLFQIEQWSPALARKIWGLTPLWTSPLSLLMGLKVQVLTDASAEVNIPFGVQNRGAGEQMEPLVLINAGEWVSKLIWQRHLNPDLEEFTLLSIEFQAQRQAKSAARARVRLDEAERERVLREIRTGQTTDTEMSVVFVDDKEQTLANMKTVWRIKSLRRQELGPGRSSK
jgi:hypothetical protein